MTWLKVEGWRERWLFCSSRYKEENLKRSCAWLSFIKVFSFHLMTGVELSH